MGRKLNNSTICLFKPNDSIMQSTKSIRHVQLSNKGMDITDFLMPTFSIVFEFVNLPLATSETWYSLKYPKIFFYIYYTDSVRNWKDWKARRRFLTNGGNAFHWNDSFTRRLCVVQPFEIHLFEFVWICGYIF